MFYTITFIDKSNTYQNFSKYKYLSEFLCPIFYFLKTSIKINMEKIAIVTIIASLIKNKKETKVIKKRKEVKRSIWSREWLQRRNSGRDIAHLAMRELQLEDPKSFTNFCRLPNSLFQKLLKTIGPTILRQDTILREAIPIATRLLISLRYLATGDTFTDLSYSFRVSVPAISRLVPETLDAIYQNLNRTYLKGSLTTEEWLNIANEFESKWNFPMCLGAIDGKHIAIRAKKTDGSFYYNYKGFNSIILLAFVDANYKFIFVDVGTNGRANDAAVFNQSQIGFAVSNDQLNFPENKELPGTNTKVPYVFVADDAFRLSKRILKPYSQRNQDENKIFNYRLSRARRVSENAFGQLSNRFQVLQKDIILDVEKAELITLVCCVLHNFIKDEDSNNDSSIECSQSSSINLTSLEKSPGHRSSEEASFIRDRFKLFFNTVGEVPWQNEAIKKFNF